MIHGRDVRVHDSAGMGPREGYNGSGSFTRSEDTLKTIHLSLSLQVLRMSARHNGRKAFRFSHRSASPGAIGTTACAPFLGISHETHSSSLQNVRRDLDVHRDLDVRRDRMGPERPDPG